MNGTNDTIPRKRFIARVWTFLWRPSARFSLATLLIVGGIGGILFWGGFHWALEISNTESFCVSCHEMRNNVYEELKSTVHYTNRSGVRATCPDCHVPKEWIHKVIRKIQATNELFHHWRGTIDTPEKFEKTRLEMAKRVWATMKANDSHECRNCHSVVSMNPHKQTAAAQVMFDAIKNGATCIDCHKGVAHKLPEEED
jgi:nitrate/TMAO reductase-like tetraheme cytochrome c subunit